MTGGRRVAAGAGVAAVAVVPSVIQALAPQLADAIDTAGKGAFAAILVMLIFVLFKLEGTVTEQGRVSVEHGERLAKLEEAARAAPRRRRR